MGQVFAFIVINLFSLYYMILDHHEPVRLLPANCSILIS